MTHPFDQPPLCILGPTASGKSSLAMALAEALGNVELVSIDSMQVYVGMDIGTAKPSAEEQARVPHHLIDVADPADEFTVSVFQDLWREVAADIYARGKTPILVGGTGLYLRSVIDDLGIPGRFPDAAAALEPHADDPDWLFAELERLDPVAASRIDASNTRRLLRALEVTLGSGRPFSTFGPGLTEYPDIPFRLLGLSMPRPRLDERIAARYEQQMDCGFLDEVQALARRARPMGRTARQALGYRELLSHVEDGVALDDALQEAKVRTNRFSRRQLKWFRRDPRISWVELGDDGTAEGALPAALELISRG